MLPLPAAGAGATGDTAMSSTQHQLIEQCATRLRGIVEALGNIHHTSPQRWLTDLDDVHSSAESLLAMIKDQAPPSEDQLIAAGLSYPLAKEDAVQLWYAGFRSEVVTVLEAWEAIGHDIGMNPSKGELLDSLRNMAAICNAHGNDMPAQSAIDQRQVIADAITGALAFGAQASQPPAEDHWLRPFYDIGRAEGQRTQELAMLVRMLASSLKRHAPDSNLVARATNYLAAKGLAGTPLRDSSASVEQAGGDERKLSDLGNELHNLSCSIVHENEEWAEQIGGIARELWNWPQARAALAQPSPVRSSLLINGYQLRAALDFIAPDGTAEQLESEACIEWRQQDADFLEAGLYAFCAEYPEEGGVLLDEEPTTAQPSPLQSEQAEAERPEVVGYLATAEHPKHGQPHKAFNYFKDQHDAQVAHWRERGCEVSDDELMTVAQHGRIVGALRARNEKLEADAGALEWLRSTFKVHKAIVEQAGCGTIEQLAEQRDAANSRLHEVSVACATAEQERDAALANVDALAVQVLKLGGTISFAHHRTDQAGQVPQAWLDVQAERRRQVEAEGWTPEHDDAHSHGEMARAAACYALAGSSAPNDGTAALLVSLAWPWDEQWWKPTTTRRDLVKACALGLAEIERLDRAAASQGGPSDA